MSIALRFDRGTLRVDGTLPRDRIPEGLLWDGRTQCWRAPAFRYRRLLSDLRDERLSFRDEVRDGLASEVATWRRPTLRSYQEDALAAWHACGRQGVVVLPTGAGKTRVALAAMAHVRMRSLILCPTRALMAQWVEQLGSWYGGDVGMVGDGYNDPQDVTVMTFESAFRRLDQLGARFGLLVVDEVHHFGGGRRSEALEMCTAPYRLGLTATAPQADSDASRHIDGLVGPVVCEVGISELLGTHLADLEVIRRSVRLEPEEFADYARLEAPFAELRRAFFRACPEADFAAMVRAVASSAMGRKAMADHHRASAIASFPRKKRELVSVLLERHRRDKTLVFTALADDAYALSSDNLIPVITAEIGRAERTEILRSFRDGKIRAIVSARVLNEGIDVPDASVGIVVAGTQGAREHVQRVGRVLRPAPGKRAVVYELITNGTMDDARARSRWRNDAS
jgi:superfamily II DNA or RNA helicase